jgi:hypothetical protein
MKNKAPNRAMNTTVVVLFRGIMRLFGREDNY